jgi:NADPH2:quinone reductase
MKSESKGGTIRIERQGAPSVLQYSIENINMPGANQVLVKQEAIALNYVDILFRNGSFLISSFPATIGVEAAGTIEAIGTGISNFKIGDRVGYYFSLGAYTQYRIIDVNSLISIPEDISFDQAASLMAKGLTARMLVKQAYSVKPGDTILVHAAAGGVGSLVSKWAKSLGALVIGTVGSAAKKEYALAHGIDHVIALDTEDLAKTIKAITGGKKIQALFDGVGKATFEQSVPLIAEGGYAVLFGASSGSPSIGNAALKENKIHLIQPVLGNYLPDSRAVAQASKDLFDAVRSGILGTITPSIYALSDAAKAHQDLESSKTKGSIIFHIN